MAHDWDSATPWANGKAIRVRNKRVGSGDISEFTREAWHQAASHPVHGWNPPAGDTPYFFVEKATRLASLLGLQASDRILIVDALLGFLVEAFKDLGYPNTFGMTGFTHMQDRVDAESRVDVVITKRDMRGANTVGQIQTALVTDTGASTFDWIITYDFLQRLTDPQAGIMDANIDTFIAGADGSKVVHCVVSSDPRPSQNELGNPILIPRSQDPEYFFRTFAEYRTLCPRATIVNWENVTLYNG